MTKDRILAKLKRDERYVSGEDMSGELGVTRAAVSAAVKALRAEGYEIDAVTNRGYRLISSPDVISYGELLPFLDEERMSRLTLLKETDSTNNALAEMALDGAPDGQTVIADSQNGGRGRKGRSFFSPPGSGIYLSYLMRPGKDGGDFSPAAWTTLTSKTAVAVSNAIESVTSVRPGIKWVNDLYLNGRKVCGILTQMDMDMESGDVRSVIVGIGINVNGKKSNFPKELKGIAGTVSDAIGNPVERARLASCIIIEMDALRNGTSASEAEYLELYRKSSIVTGKDITVSDHSGEKHALALGIEDDYALRVRFNDGTEEALRGGEISVRM